ncbi:MAG: zinc ribbon domain-containing protein [SAR202 cluster bacterium]|nr:zinc ribbon domain-containing protein [SAR202 cluster bacterium]
MPLYEYFCSDCDIRFELRRSMKQSGQQTNCPSCDGNAQRALSMFATVATSTNAAPVPAPSGAGGCGNCACGH